MIIIRASVQMAPAEGDKMRLLSDFVCEIDGVKFTVPKGFVWDGASLPRAAWTLHGHPYDKEHLAPGLWHDAAYSGLFAEQGVDKIYADAVYFRWLRANDFGLIQAVVEWLAVAIFGGSHWVKV